MRGCELGAVAGGLELEDVLVIGSDKRQKPIRRVELECGPCMARGATARSVCSATSGAGFLCTVYHRERCARVCVGNSAHLTPPPLSFYISYVGVPIGQDLAAQHRCVPGIFIISLSWTDPAFPLYIFSGGRAMVARNAHPSVHVCGPLHATSPG